MTNPSEPIQLPQHGGTPQADFPIKDTYEDFAGKTRTFEINYDVVPTGFVVRAMEVGKKTMPLPFVHSSESSLRQEARLAPTSQPNTYTPTSGTRHTVSLPGLKSMAG